jgi:hypothetical protein
MAAAVDEEFSFSDLAPAAAAASSSFHHVQSPRVIQGCVATFLQLFEWYPGCKRISSASDKLHRRRRSSCKSAVAHHGGFKEHCTDSLGAKLLLDDEEEEEDLNLWYTGAGAMSHKWSEKQNFARRRSTSTSTSTGLCVDDHEPNYCNKQVPGGVVARLMGLDSLPIKKAPGIPHLGETPHTDSEMLHGNLSSTLTKQSELTEKDLLLTGNQAPKQLLLDLEEEEEEAFGNRTTAKGATMTTKATTTHHLLHHHHHHQAGEKKQPSLFQLHYTGILKNRKGVFLTPESCLEADLDVKLLGPVLEPISGSFWGPVLEPKCLKKKSTPERNQTSLKGSRDDHSERIIQSERSQAIQFSGVTPHEEIQLNVKRRRRRKMPSSGYGLTDLTSNLKSSPSETSSLWEEESTFSSHDSATEEAHGESNLQKQKTHNNVFTNFELPQRSQSVYQVERTPVQSNHCRRFADEQCKHSSDLQQIRDDGIFSQVSNLQNEKSFTNMKKENETRSMEIVMDQKQQQQEGLSSRVKVDMKWDEASSECNKSELELNDGWGFKLVKSTQRLDYRTRKEEKESPLDGPSHQSPKSPLWSSGSDATAAETNKVIHGSCQLKPCGKHCSNKKQPKFNESSSSSSSAKSNQSEISSRVLDHGTTVNVMMKTKSCSDFKELLLLPGDHNFAGFNLTKTASDAGLSEFTSTVTSAVARELFSDQSLKPNFAHLGKKKKCPQSHTKPRSINEVFPELPMEPETMTSSLNLSQRSYKGDNCMMRTTTSENWPSTPGPQIPNNWIHETTSVFTDFAPAISGHCLPARSPLLQVDHDEDSSSSQAFQQDHSSLHRLFMSDSESSSSSFSPIGSCSAWGSKVKSSSSPKKDEEVIIVECDDHLDTKSSSTACSKSSPDSDEKFRMSVDDASWTEDAVTPIFEKKKLLMDIETKVPSSMSMRLDKNEDNAKLLQASAAASVEECGQPSPVSILESPFLDESPTTTSEESISGKKLSAKQTHKFLMRKKTKFSDPL